MFRILSLCCLVLSLSLGAEAKRITTYEEFKAATDAACMGKAVNASCQVTVDNGATFQVGVCVQLPSSTPGNIQLGCQLNIPDIISSCKNFAFGKDPGSTVTVAALLGLLLLLRRSKRSATLKA